MSKHILLPGCSQEILVSNCLCWLSLSLDFALRLKQLLNNLGKGSFSHSSLWPEWLVVMKAISLLQRNMQIKQLFLREWLHSRVFLKDVSVLVVLALGWTGNKAALAQPQKHSCVIQRPCSASCPSYWWSSKQQWTQSICENPHNLT